MKSKAFIQDFPNMVEQLRVQLSPEMATDYP